MECLICEKKGSGDEDLSTKWFHRNLTFAISPIDEAKGPPALTTIEVEISPDLVFTLWILPLATETPTTSVPS